MKSKNTDYSITSIKKIELYEENTDADPFADDAKIYIVFGNKNGEEVRLPDKKKLDYSIVIYSYAHNKNNGDMTKLVSLDGKLISSAGFTSIFVKLPSLTTDTDMLINTKVKLPSGKTLQYESKKRFNLKNY